MIIRSTLTILLLSIAFELQAQDLTIRGSVTSDNQLPLMGATIQIDSLRGVSTDEEGRFELDILTPTTELFLKVKMLGFRDLDTLIKIDREENYFEFILEQDAYLLPTAEIPANQFNLFDNNTWNLLDNCILDEKHFVLAYQNNKRKLFIFSSSGNLLKQKQLHKKYNRILLSCQNQLHLIGDEVYSKVTYQYDNLNISPYDSELYNNLIKKCILMNKGEYIFKELSHHNKIATYFRYPEPGKPQLIKKISDKKAQKASNSYYHQIIGAYSAIVEEPDSTNIAYGIEQVNIVANGEWSGDLKELIVTNEIHSLVSYYLNVVSQEIDVHEFSVNDTMFIFDLNGNALHAIDTKRLKSKKIALNSSDFKSKSQIVKDELNGDIYLIKKNYEIYKIHISESEVTLTFISRLSSSDVIHRKYTISDGQLFYITKETGRPRSRMHKLELTQG